MGYITILGHVYNLSMLNSANGADRNPEPMRVLIADDVLETRRSTRLMMTLVPDARVVAIAQNGREALELVKEHEPDVVLMDVNMPEMNGLRAIELIRKYRPDTACIVLSAERSQETVKKAMKLGVQDYLIKPFTSDQLLAVMQRAREEVIASRWNSLQAAKQKEAHEKELIEMAEEYMKTRRTDAQAMIVFEELSSQPDCDERYLRTLAIIYVFRQRWRRLRYLARHLEKRTK